VYCWGSNRVGQLGDGGMSDRASPTLVAGGRRMSAVAATYARTCGVGADSLAYCWGATPGDGGAIWRSQPTIAHPQLHFAQLSVAGGHTCGVTPSGAGYCWGDNSAGQLGSGRPEAMIATPVRVIDPR
jgi:alpha-tubulin suppressor-like RCC1 family protein